MCEALKIPHKFSEINEETKKKLLYIQTVVHHFFEVKKKK